MLTRDLGVFLSFLVILGWAAPAQATTSYEFAQAAVNSLGDVRDAQYSTVHEKPVEGSDERLLQVLKQTVFLRTKIKNAGYSLIPYKDSKDKQISDGIDLLLGSYTLLDTNLSESQTILERIINNPNDSLDKQGTLLAQIYQIQANMDDAWKMLAKATVGVELCIFDQTRLDSNGNVHYLRVTSAERKELQDLIFKRFGSSINSANNTLGGEMPGQILWDFFNNAKFISADN